MGKCGPSCSYLDVRVEDAQSISKRSLSPPSVLRREDLISGEGLIF